MKHWGINPSSAFIGQPQTNGLAEREAVGRFVDTYNREWLVEKDGFLSPWQARVQWLAQHSPGPLKKNLCPENRVRYNDDSFVVSPEGEELGNIY